jgi:hypothetical protein
LTEILTESFCERCGTRYTFESAAPRRARLGKVRTLGKGMKNFVLSDDASFSEAMAEARSEQELTAVNHQLDAFHQTFNFCLTCRQYTCGDCWNDADGRCLTCSPLPGLEEPMAAEFAEAPAMESLPEPQEADAWPDADLSNARLSRVLGLDEAELQASAEAGAEDEQFEVDAALAAAAVLSAAPTPTEDAQPDPVDAEPVASADAAPVEAAVIEEPEVEAGAVEQPEIEAAAPEPQVAGVAPGQSLEDAIAEYEARLDSEQPEPDIEPLAATADDPVEPALEQETEPAIAPIVAVAAAAAVVGPAEAPIAEIEPEPADDVDPLRIALAAAALAGHGDAPEHEPQVVHIAAEPVLPVEAAQAPEAEAVAEADAVAVAPAEPEPVEATHPDEPDAHAGEPGVDVVPQPTWPQPAPAAEAPAPQPAPEQPVVPANPWLTVAPDESDGPQWPATPVWPANGPRLDVPATLVGRPLVPYADPSGMWAASAAEVLTAAAQAPQPAAAAAPTPTAQPCVSCGLSLSANARFCRRCGTRQG